MATKNGNRFAVCSATCGMWQLEGHESVQRHGRFLKKIHLLSLEFKDLYALLLYIRTNERNFTVSSHNVLIRQPHTHTNMSLHASVCVWLCLALLLLASIGNCLVILCLCEGESKRATTTHQHNLTLFFTHTLSTSFRAFPTCNSQFFTCFTFHKYFPFCILIEFTHFCAFFGHFSLGFKARSSSNPTTLTHTYRRARERERERAQKHR